LVAFAEEVGDLKTVIEHADKFLKKEIVF